MVKIIEAHKNKHKRVTGTDKFTCVLTHFTPRKVVRTEICGIVTLV